MKEKLKKFKSFAQILLPHELRYLLSIQRFQDPEKLQIIENLVVEAETISQVGIYDETIDKRKYSYIQKWIKNELDKIDVDKKYLWINTMQQDISLDRISSEDEAAILKSLNSFTNTSYYFSKHFVMLIELRQYLLIRKRYAAYKKVDTYLNEYTYDYQRSLLINRQMDQATKEIMGFGTKSINDSSKWEKWLKDTFMNEHLDGLNRYMAFIRLSYHYLNENKLDNLEETYKNVQSLFENGHYYSRRLLFNFYTNSLVLYDRKKDYPKAYYYGMLSIKGTGPDQLLYFNNFINIMMKQGKYDAALSLIQATAFKISEFKDFYSVVGYVSYHIRCLLKTDHLSHALNKAKVFWEDRKARIMEYRWHRFLSAYIEALLANQEYLKIIRLVNRYKLIPLEQERKIKTQALHRSIEAMYYLAMYYCDHLTKKDVISKLEKFQLPDVIQNIDTKKY